MPKLRNMLQILQMRQIHSCSFVSVSSSTGLWRRQYSAINGNVQNVAIIVKVAVVTSWFLSHLQHLVDVKMREVGLPAAKPLRKSYNRRGRNGLHFGRTFCNFLLLLALTISREPDC